MGGRHVIGAQLSEAVGRIAEVLAEATSAVADAGTTADLEALRVKYAGKKSALQGVTSVMRDLSGDERKQLGAALNDAKSQIESAIVSRDAELRRHELEDRLRTERVDVTLPGTSLPHGYRHPLLQCVRDLLGILGQMGYAIYEGPEVEWERYNFDLLNTPTWHPARDEQDTFWVREGVVLRTQTSPSQIRYMEQNPPPIRVAVPGFVYRNEAEDPSHGDMFYQIEGLAVDVDITLADLKGTLLEVCRRYFGADSVLRFRPHYFPFTEPSAEIDIQCRVCHGAGCRSCGGEGWLELGGSGMVHPSVLEAGGYDPEQVSGFAFGLGPNRYAMMKHGIPDLRMFRENDLRFLREFN
jgi:phenylalanyl-tRNA synthetase alpha chain